MSYLTANQLTAIIAGNFLNLGMLLVFGRDEPLASLAVLLSWGCAYLGSFIGEMYASEHWQWQHELACGLHWACLCLGGLAFGVAINVLARSIL